VFPQWMGSPPTTVVVAEAPVVVAAEAPVVAPEAPVMAEAVTVVAEARRVGPDGRVRVPGRRCDMGETDRLGDRCRGGVGRGGGTEQHRAGHRGCTDCTSCEATGRG